MKIKVGAIMYMEGLVETYTRPVMLAQALWAHSSFDHVDLEGLDFFGFLHPLYYSFLVSSLESIDTRGDGFDEPFSTEYSKVSHSLHNFWLWVFLFVSIWCKKEAYLMMTNKSLIFDCFKLFFDKHNFWQEKLSY